jgi:hypothetical protein
MMRLLARNDDGDFYLTTFFGGNIPRYAILSHTWGAEELSFKDLEDGSGKKSAGYDKIVFCGKQAERDSLQYFWVDTCCIDKSSSAELTEAINSMFRWYREAAKCYVYLSDVSGPVFNPDNKSYHLPWEAAFRSSRWFTRGWTLQELIAPKTVEFFTKDGERLGDRVSLEQHISKVAGIPVEAFRGGALSSFSIAERMSWADKRETTQEEDKAYSQLGIFDVSMPLIYGEGRPRALKRLREEIDKATKGKSFSYRK